MFSAKLFTLATTLALAAVQPTRGAQFNVTVGGSDLKFDPEFVTAAVGDTIVFNFHAKNHTATQSSFASPCKQIPGGFDTGFVPVPVNNTDGPFPAAALTITDQNPIWVFCAQEGHCSAGMVFAVNPGDKFDAFKAAATGAPASTSSSAVPSSSTSASSYSPASGIGSSSAPASLSSTASGSSAASSSAASASSSASPAASSASASASSSASSAASSTATSFTVSAPAPSTTATSTSSSSSYSFVPPPMTASVSRPAPSPTAISNDHRIFVGDGGLTFSPANITADIGDTLTFEFRSGNHSATASSFGSPCVPLSETSPENAGAFDSGFMPVPSGGAFPTFTVQINNTSPVWVFCKQANHCGQGMVFAVNAGTQSSNSFPAFLSNAEKLNGTTGNAGAESPKSAAGRTWAAGTGAIYLALATLGAVISL